MASDTKWNPAISGREFSRPLFCELMAISDDISSVRDPKLGRRLLQTIAAYSIFGLIGNALLSLSLANKWGMLRSTVNAFNILAMVLILAVLVVCVRRRKCSLRDYGILLNCGFWVSLVLISVVVLLKFQGLTLFPPLDLSIPFRVLQAFTEEIVFRAILIGQVCILLKERPYSVLIAIMISAALFTLVHIPLEHASGLLGLLLSSIVMGYLYHWTRSVLFLIAFHVLSNTAGAYGLWGLVFAVVAYLLIVLYSSATSGVGNHQSAESSRRSALL